MALGVLELLILAVMVGQVALLLFALISLAKAPDDALAAAGFNRYVWLAIIIVLPLLGPIAYYMVAYPKIRRPQSVPST